MTKTEKPVAKFYDNIPQYFTFHGFNPYINLSQFLAFSIHSYFGFQSGLCLWETEGQEVDTKPVVFLSLKAGDFSVSKILVMLL